MMRRTRRSLNRLLRGPWRARPEADLLREVPADVRQSLQRAHAQLDEGQAGQAAAILSMLAKRAEQTGDSRGGWMHLQAARAWKLAGEKASAEDHAREGLRLLGPWLRPQRHERLSRRIALELDLAALAPSAGSPEGAAGADLDIASSIGQLLPAKCPQCGATVRPDEAEPLSDGRAACAYCGSILSANPSHG